jgi:twitching motility protein PilT
MTSATIDAEKNGGLAEMTDKTAPMRRTRRATDPHAGPVEECTPSIDSLLERVVEMGASDLHIATGIEPTVRVDGELITLSGTPIFTCEMAEHFIQSLMTISQWEEFQRELELDFSFGRRGLGRYRVGVFRERGDASAVLRTIPQRVLQLDELGLPRSVAEFAWLKQGLVLVTGPSGSGKTTTLTAIIDKINRERKVHIITIEDPIEYVHVHNEAIVRQREIGRDTTSFTRALRSSLREDPDVLLIGEMRDTETIAATVSAAETGHLVFATLHTNSAAQSIERIVDGFPPHQQSQIRYQLAGSLTGVISQRLIPTIDGGRVCVAEVLIVNGAVRNLIREGKTHQIASAMHSGLKEGMVIFDMHLAELVKNRRVHREVALGYAMDPASFESRLRP